jgi:hypothetical protein
MEARMPVRNGRWISPAKVAAEQKTYNIERNIEEPDVPAPEPEAEPTRRSSAAAAAAIAEATGAKVTLDSEPADALLDTGDFDSMEFADEAELEAFLEAMTQEENE